MAHTRKIYLDGEVLYDSTSATPDDAIGQPTLKYEIGKAGSLTFSIYPTHPKYDQLFKMKSQISFEEDDEELFFGRIFSVEVGTWLQKAVTCEGILNVLNDFTFGKTEVTTTPSAFFSTLIGAHNSAAAAAGETWKQFTVGTVNVDDMNDDTTIKVNNIGNIKGILDSSLINKFNGFLRVRKSGNVRYLDWLKSYNVNATQTLAIGENIVELQDTQDGEDIFSYLIGTGKDDTSTGEIKVSDEAVEKYGKIVKIVGFDDISDSGQLQAMAERYIEDNWHDTPRSITVTAVDLHLLNPNVTRIHIGDNVLLVSEAHGLNEWYTCTAIEYDICEPQNNRYTFEYLNNASEARTGGSASANLADIVRQRLNAVHWDDIIQNKEFMQMQAENLNYIAEKTLLLQGNEEVFILGGDFVNIDGDVIEIGNYDPNDPVKKNNIPSILDVQTKLTDIHSDIVTIVGRQSVMISGGSITLDSDTITLGGLVNAEHSITTINGTLEAQNASITALQTDKLTATQVSSMLESANVIKANAIYVGGTELGNVGTVVTNMALSLDGAVASIGNASVSGNTATFTYTKIGGGTGSFTATFSPPSPGGVSGAWSGDGTFSYWATDAAGHEIAGTRKTTSISLNAGSWGYGGDTNSRRVTVSAGGADQLAVTVTTTGSGAYNGGIAAGESLVSVARSGRNIVVSYNNTEKARMEIGAGINLTGPYSVGSGYARADATAYAYVDGVVYDSTSDSSSKKVV